MTLSYLATKAIVMPEPAVEPLAKSNYYTPTPPHDFSSMPDKPNFPSPSALAGVQSRPTPAGGMRGSADASFQRAYTVSLEPYARSTGSHPHHQSLHLPSFQDVQLPGCRDLAQPNRHRLIEHEAFQSDQVPMIPNGPKRAYRQRRKDPSCDACRERKVKCDATDSVSCTECTSRNSICQFTKDTNRRMTSMKHNQDLIKELARTRSELDQYKRITEGRPTQLSPPPLSSPVGTQLPTPDLSDSYGHHAYCSRDAENTSRSQARSDKPVNGHAHFELDLPVEKRRRLMSYRQSLPLKRNLQIHGRGIIRSPFRRSTPTMEMIAAADIPELPPKHIADGLLRRYKLTLNAHTPILHWPTFRMQYDSVYMQRSFDGRPRIWVGLLFMVFAIGSLHEDRDQSQEFFETSRSHIDPWAENLNTDHVRAALLTSIFLLETNRRSASGTWLGIASRTAYDVGLHCESGSLSPVEVEIRRRVWWSICIYDRIMCLETGHPVLIRDEDHAIPLPSPVDDESDGNTEERKNLLPTESTSSLISTLEVTCGNARLLEVLRAPIVTPEVLSACDLDISKRLSRLLSQHRLHGYDYLNPLDIRPLIYLQNARLIFHRRNLNPLGDTLTRMDAIDRCASVARDTAYHLERCMQMPPPKISDHATESGETWKVPMLSAMSACLCTHVWRCTLFLVFRLDLRNALTCAKASSVWGTKMEVNAACGRYLEFFLQHTISKLHQGRTFDTDEELIAYLSGDQQSSPENSWVWRPSGGPSTSEMGQLNGSISRESSAEVPDGPLAKSTDQVEWNGWDGILETMGQLQRELQCKTGPLTGSTHSPDRASSTVSPSRVTNNRLRIEDLI